MNDVLREAAGAAEHTWLVGVATLVFMALFVGVVIWLLSKRARAGLDEAARLPLEREEEE